MRPHRFAGSDNRFNPHFPQRGSATRERIGVGRQNHGFNPHFPQRGSATAWKPRLRPYAVVSILTSPKGEVQRQDPRIPVSGIGVSILTSPKGEVQRVVACFLLSSSQVSILTSPKGEVQPPDLTGIAIYSQSFNPHFPQRGSATPACRPQCQ